MFKLKRAVCWLLVCSILCTTIPVRTSAGDARTVEFAGDASNVSQDDGNAPGKEPEGLRFRLSEGAEQPEARETTTPAPAVRLSESETENVLKRLPPLKPEAGDEQDFALRERSLPPPRTGRTINTAFPATSETRPPAPNETGALEVVRFAPEGEVSLAPQLSVTFSQPMVAVTSLAELASESVPVELAPRVEGRWRWLGTKTLLFEPQGRLPMATRFTATVRAGAKSSAGATLAAAKSWNFSTPAPKVRSSYPSGNASVRRDAVIFISFDQRINPAEVLRTIKVRAGADVLPVRLATTAEIEADAGVSALVKAETEGRWLALRALRGATNETQSALPPNSNISVTIGPGTPSAEGPRTTDKPQTFSFRTYGALRIVEHQCSSGKTCKPDGTWMITFSNPLDAQAFEQSQIRVEPALRGMQASIYDNDIHINGDVKGRTTYRVTFARTLKDEFGQTLGEDVTVTFNVGAADPSLSAENDGFVVLDPSAPRRFSVYTVNLRNLKVSLYGVGPADWSRFTDYMRYIKGYADPAAVKQHTPPGKLLHTQNVAVASAPDELTETSIDLTPALAGETFGHVVVRVESGLDGVVRRRGGRQTVNAWVEVTNIGLDAFVDRTDLLGWATSLEDGAPLSGVEMSIYPTQAKALSGVEGLARIALPQQADDGRRLLVARRGRDVAILPEHSDWWTDASNWYKKQPEDSLLWYVFDDRKMYRPGEEVHVKGWLRRVGAGRGGDVNALDGAAQSVSYTLKDSRGNEILKNSVRLNALGGFDTSFKLPPTVNLGHARLDLSAQGGSAAGEGRQHTHLIQVQEFRRPEFEVTAQASEGPHVVGEHADASVSAFYYAGGGLANAEVNWSVRATPAHFTPPNRGDFTFGTWVPWWRASSRREPGQTQTYKGTTDASGKHRLRIDFDSVSPPRPTSVAATANVADVNRQTWASTTTLLVHPSDLYVGLRTPRTFVERGQPVVVESIVTDIDGRAVAQREIRARAVLLEWVFERGEWRQKETNAQECNVRSATDAVRCTFETREGGVYRVSASVIDERERRNESELTIWVAGGKTPPARGVAQETVELIPDRKEYGAGETAEVLVQSPFAPAEGLLTLRRSGIVRTERFRMNTASHTLKIPVEEGFTPNVHVQVDLVGAGVRTNEEGQPDAKLPTRPAYATGTINLPIPPVARKLSVRATPREKALEPGATTVVDVEVRDAQGRPVKGGEMAVVVVDESVLSLTGYRIPDPLDIFYMQRSADTEDRHARQHVLLGNPSELSKPVVVNQQSPGTRATRLALRRGIAIGGGAGVGGGGLVMNEQLQVMAPVQARAAEDRDGFSFQFYLGKREEAKAEAAETIRLRENFDALAVFAAALPTDAEGRAQVEVKLPDNLTRYRVMAVSVAGGKQFGAGESAITARMPLMVRPSAPRFLNFGDRIELPVVVQNQTDAAMSVDVAVRAVNAELTEGAGRRVTVAANDRVEVRFPVAAVRAGIARFQLGALAGRMTDAAEVQLPVWTPATTEAFATYGELDDGAILQSVRAPAGVFKEFGGLEITTSSTQLQELTDAVLYLSNYPYECSEQISSRVLGIAALRDVLTAFQAKGLPSPKELEAAVERDIRRLRVLQNEDGGFAFWKRGDPSWPYISIHVAHALQRAKEKRFDVPQAMLDASRRYLRAIETHIPADYSIESKRALIAYALNVRARMGDRDTARAQRLIAEAGLENLSLEAVGWLLPVLSKVPAAQVQVEAIHRLLNNRVEETAANAHFTTRYSDGERVLLHSERRADGIILEALIGDRPASDLIPKIVRGLLAHRTAGRWSNTQENAFILLALDRYFGTYEKLTPDFVARAWLGDAFAGEHAYRGRTTERQHVQIPMSYLLKESPAQQNLTLGKEGAGRLYYRLGMQYAPASLKLDAADYGFNVERAYEAIDDPADVRRDSDGAWHVKAGARVRVRLTLSAPTRRYHVALTDPLPAGLEILNPSLAVTGDVPADTKEVKTGGNRWGWWSYQGWFEHQNLRDERAEAFTSLLWEGVYTYSYVARATTPGLFVVPPPKAEEMYHPENFGRGATDRVRVE
ncbi:MAG TPA: alpha-2-macroglobulin family protein [Pyrinomonadaceae bacterium]|nr:alpha-2-macroglobulin family protein [Pyrinomonadaceae bacterium]